MVSAGWKAMCLWFLLSEDNQEVLGMCWGSADSTVSLQYQASSSTVWAELFLILTADGGLDVYIISLRNKCNGNGEVPSQGWQTPQCVSVNISQAKWSEMGEIDGTVLEIVLLKERCLFVVLLLVLSVGFCFRCLFFFFFCLCWKIFLLYKYNNKTLIAMRYIEVYVNIRE